jgi:site-specific recombinase XerC
MTLVHEKDATFSPQIGKKIVKNFERNIQPRMEYSEVKNVISANANPNHLKKIRIDSSSH